jgi:GH25 family lysozyme M1 (1,4-beta-N-acetylmuramidase)
MAKVIDISSWQSDIDWQAVQDAGVEGVILKIAEGETKDECFDTFLQQVKAIGLPWGCYLYTHAQNVEDAKADAETVLNFLGGEIPKMGVWYDVEAPELLALGDVTAICSAFISTLNAEGLKAGIYGGYYTLRDNVNVDALADYVPYWPCQYGVSQSDFKAEHPDKIVDGWQWSEHEMIGNTEVDMNEWYNMPE